MRFRITEHARQEMTRRSVSQDKLNKVLEQPQQVVPAQSGRKIYPSQLDFGEGKIYLVRVIVEDKNEQATVVTVYRTSKIEKYWRSV